MYVTPRQRTRYFWTTIILILMLPLTAFAAVMAIRYFTGASGEGTPKNVVITNLTSNSASITWTTDSEASGSVTTNAGKGDSAPFVDIRGTDRRKTHHVDIVDLEPSKDYSFVILSNDERFADEKGKSFKFRTSPVTSETPVPSPVYGSVEGTDKNDALVYITVDGRSTVYPASSATTATGKWIVDLSALRDPSSKDLVKIDKDTNITITAKGIDTLGGSIAGTYGELVDSEGQLTTQIALSDVPTDSLFSSIPKVAQIASVLAQVPTTPDPEPNEPEPLEPEEPGIIGQDVEWGVLAGTSVSGGSSAQTGSDSVQITNITDTGFNVVWLSSANTEGSVKYGTTPTALSETALDERDSAVSKGKYTVHSVRLTRLQPETTYYFEAYDDATALRDGSSPFSIKTFATLSTPPEFKTVTGKISNISTEAIVLLSLNDEDSTGTSGTSTLGSTLSDATGNWVATLGDMRNTAGSEYYTFSDKDTLDLSAVSLASIKGTSITSKKAIDDGVTLASTSETQRKIVKIASLVSYNVYSSTVPTVSDQTGGGGDDVVIDGDTTPNTAISTPLLVTLIIAIVAILFGSLMYISGNFKYKENNSKNRMISSVN